MFQKFHSFLWLALFISSFIISCKSQPETINEIQKEITQTADSIPVEKDPCTPPPPCLDPWERPFYLKFQMNEGSHVDFQVLASKKSNSSVNYTITTKPTATENLFKIECMQPFRLTKGKDNSIKLFIKESDDTFNTISIKFREEEISCCPVLIPNEIKFNKKTIHNDYKRGQIIHLPF